MHPFFDRVLPAREAAHAFPRRQRECVTAAKRGRHRPRRRRTHGASGMLPSTDVNLSANSTTVELGGIEKLQLASTLIDRSSRMSEFFSFFLSQFFSLYFWACQFIFPADYNKEYCI